MKILSTYSKNLAMAVLCTLMWSGLQALASSPSAPLSQETQDDIAKHRTISAAHEAAAKCLESGKSDEYCEGQLLAACKGIAIGKFCGMKH